MAWVTLGALEALADVANADLIAGPTLTRSAVDARVGAAVPPHVAAAMAADTAVRDALLAGVTDAVAELNLAEATKLALTDVNVDSMRDIAEIGPYSVAASATVTGLPTSGIAGTFIVSRGPADASPVHMWVTDATLWYRKAVNATEWGPWVQVADAADVPLPRASYEILELARADGWLAVYDPGNPGTRTVARGTVAEIRDGLGNLPNAVAGNFTSMPGHDRGHFGMLDGMNFGATGAANALRTGLFDTPMAQPTFILAVGQLRADVPVPAARVMIDGQTSSGRNSIFVGTGDGSGGFGFFAGSERVARDLPEDNEPHLFGAQFDGRAGSRFFVDGVPQFLRDTSTGSFTHPLNGLTIGNRFSGTGRHWDGWIGPVLIYPGVPSDEVRERMTRLLRAYMNPDGYTVDTVASESAVRMSADGILFGKDPHTPKSPASITKVLSGYTARQVVGDARLDETVTVLESDVLTGTGTSPQLLDGDQITWRDLFHLMMLPSHNAAARVVARAVGSELSGGGTPIERFITAMNAHVTAWAWEGSEFFDPTGMDTRNRMSAAQAAELMLRCHDEDAFLTATMGKLTHTVAVQGPNARNITVTHTINPSSRVALPEFLAGKTGTWAGSGSVATLVETGGTVESVVTMRVVPAENRLRDVRRILDGETSVSRSSAVVEADNSVSRVLVDDASFSRSVLDDMYEPRHQDPVSVDLSEVLPDAVFDSGSSALSIQRSGPVVEFSVAAVRFPADMTAVAAIPDGYKPIHHAYGLNRDRATGGVCEVQVSTGGTVNIRGNAASDVLRVTMTWLTDDPEPPRAE